MYKKNVFPDKVNGRISLTGTIRLGNCSSRGVENCSSRGVGNCCSRGVGNCSSRGVGNCSSRGVENCSSRGAEAGSPGFSREIKRDKSKQILLLYILYLSLN